ncbi:MAG TPA: saccharopine dehydrogenase C-terminal domain-containing protein [Candidatus Saccharicenans sp.]|jgi:saccharopine dehydrogenase-like NADP-dependent oxidoreductase|nr:saccharopine dehydrogenase NADP-binding domain-containing protein [Candidatus Saccharicenans sp.]HRD01085.1 saccharopine dehydrogenase C-terminal domain-containing protein [Candidatus Saccharicenans sp.]
MKKVCVLGAGLVARPLVEYLLDLGEVEVKVADLEEERARRLVGQHPRGQAFHLDLRDKKKLEDLVADVEVVASMVPYTFHPYVASICLELGKHLVTASYVSPEMRNFDGAARSKGLIFLNECGLDPGLDHMEAKQCINQARAAGGEVLTFISYCGGLPAPEASTNPFGYKFSWSPRGVLLAGRNEARYLKDGQEVVIPADELFDHFELVEIPDLGQFEAYPNRNSVIYREIYDIPEVRSILRGTLRYSGWCVKLKKMGELGLLDITEREWTATTYAGFIQELLGIKETESLAEAVASRLGIDPDSETIRAFDWLGLFSARPLPAQKSSPLDLLTAIMWDKMQYGQGERDMNILQHELLISYPSGQQEKLVSTLIDFGQPGGHSSMSRLVGWPVALGVKLILQNKIKSRGVLIPTTADIYEPILAELKALGVKFKEEKELINN